MPIDRYFNPDLTTGANDGTSEADAWQTWNDLNQGTNAIASGQVVVHCKNPPGGWAPGAFLSWSTNANAARQFHLVGYATTPGDGGPFELVQAAGQNMILAGDGVRFERWSMSNSGVSAGGYIIPTGSECTFVGCQLSLLALGATDGFVVDQSGDAPMTFIGCDFQHTLSGAAAACVRGDHIVAIDCSFRSNAAGLSFRNGGRSHVVSGCDFAPRSIAPTSMRAGIELAGTGTSYNVVIDRSRFVRCSSAIDVNAGPSGTGVGVFTMTQNVIYDCAIGLEWGGTLQYPITAFGNAFGLVPIPYFGLDFPTLLGDVSLPSDPFRNAAIGDLRVAIHEPGAGPLYDVPLASRPAIDEPVIIADVPTCIARNVVRH